MESYTASTTLAVKNELATAIELDIKLLGDLGKLLKDIASINAFGGMAKQIGSITTAFGKAAGNAERFGKIYSDVADGAGKLSGVVSQTNELAAAAREAATAERELATASGRVRGPGGARSPEREGRPRAGFSHAGMDMMMGGAILEGMGREILGGVADIIKPAAGYQHQVELLRVMGMLPDEIAAAEKAAWKDRVATASPEKALAAIGEMRGVLGSTEEAIKFMPNMLRLQSTMEAETGKHQEGLAYQAILAVENLGGTVDPKTRKIDSERAEKYLDVLSRIAILTHGKLGPQELLGFAKQAGFVARNITPQGLMELAPIMQGMGAQKAGTALTAMNAQIVNGIMPERVYEDWKTYGLVDKNKVRGDKLGMHLAKGAILHEDDWMDANGNKQSGFKTNPVAWMENTLIPRLEELKFSPEKQNEIISHMMARQTGGRIAVEIANSLTQIHRDYENMQKNMGATAFDELIRNDFPMQLQRFGASLETFETAAGGSALPMIAEGLNSVSTELDNLADWARDNPGTVRELVKWAGALGLVATTVGGLLVFGGSISMLAGILASPIAGPITLIATALGLLAVAAITAEADLAKKDKTTGLMSETAAEHSKDDPSRDRGWVGYFSDSARLDDIEDNEFERWEDNTIAGFKEWRANFKASFEAWQSETSDALRGIPSAIGNYFMEDVNDFKSWGTKIAAEWKQWDMEVLAQIGEFGQNLWTGFTTMLSNISKAIIAYMKDLPNNLFASVAEISPGSAQDVGKKAGEAASTGWGWLWNSGTAAGAGAAAIRGPVAPPAAQSTNQGSSDPAGFRAQVAAAQAQQPPIHIQPGQAVFNIDGRTIATAIMEYMARQPGGPNVGPTDFNTAGMFSPAGTSTGMAW